MSSPLKIICDTRAHCVTCRKREEGRPLRAGWAEAFGLKSPDFACPYGLPWEGKAPRLPRSRGLGDTVAKVIKAATLGKVKPCGKCRKRQEALNKLVPYRDGE